MLIEAGLLSSGVNIVASAVGGTALSFAGMAEWSLYGANLLCMAVIYQPRWVMSFDDRLYLAQGR